MPTEGNAWQRSLQAAESAGRLLDEMEIDQTRQIDVFTMCEDLNIWLAFLPMDRLLGAYVPEGTGGILITDQRPITVQRYTAAHELGHWRLEHGHGVALDGEEHVFGANPAERERLAQLFAANLLMPPPLVFSLLARIGVEGRSSIRSDQAYFIAREAGVSYEAAVRQLNNLQVISIADATSLLETRPIKVKRQLAGGRRPVYGYADVWPVDEQWNDQLISLRVDDEIVVSLPENRSTGYRWMFDDENPEYAPMPEPPENVHVGTDSNEFNSPDHFLMQVRTAIVRRAPKSALARIRATKTQIDDSSDGRYFHGDAEFVGDEYVTGRGPVLRPNDLRRARIAVASGALTAGVTGASVRTTKDLDEESIGATGRRLLGIRFIDPGPKTLRLEYRSPFRQGPPVEEFVLHALVEARRKRFSIDQLVDDRGEPWVDEVRERMIHEPTAPIDDPKTD